MFQRILFQRCIIERSCLRHLRFTQNHSIHTIGKDDLAVFPAIFLLKNSVGSWNSTRHIFQRKSLGSPIPQVEMKHPFSKTLKIYSFFLWGSLLCVRSFQNEKNASFSRGFFEANPVRFHLMVSIKMDKSKAAMKMPERWWPQTILALEEETANPKSSPLMHLFGESA